MFPTKKGKNMRAVGKGYISLGLENPSKLWGHNQIGGFMKANTGNTPSFPALLEQGKKPQNKSQ